LRIMGLQDEFELAALDFCVTYEVSPPPWEDARCELLSGSLNCATGAGLAQACLRDRVHEAPVSWGQAQTEPIGLDTMPASVVELAGELLGDAAETLDKLKAGLQGLSRLVISCDRLIRVDFSAAGSILNWVAARESEGCHVQFREVPCLVATFFNVIGINEHARVLVRNT
jgi:ABC-type transporter Mla MlaB component